MTFLLILCLNLQLLLLPLALLGLELNPSSSHIPNSANPLINTLL
jgi:hypothetical protein